MLILVIGGQEFLSTADVKKEESRKENASGVITQINNAVEFKSENILQRF